MVNIHPDLTIRFAFERSSIFSYAENQSKEFTVEFRTLYESEETFNENAFTGRDAIINEVNKTYEQWLNSENIVTNSSAQLIFKGKKFKIVKGSQQRIENRERSLAFNSFILEAPIDEETHKTLWSKTRIKRMKTKQAKVILFISYSGKHNSKFLLIAKT